VTIIAHGGRLSEARRLFPHAPEPWLDLSTGINPLPYPLPPLSTELFARLPDPDDVAALQVAAAKAYGVSDPAMVVAAPGTQILIDLLPRLWPATSVSVLGPTYAEHALSWQKAGARVATIPVPAIDHVVVLCNPNNPDGRRTPVDRLLALADSVADRNGMLVVDEAFADLEDDELSLANRLPHRAIVVLRSFGKTYGLAGLRLGFALAAPERAALIRDALGPWAVSGPAIAIGRLALQDRDWLAATRTRLSHDTAMLDAYLTNGGLRVVGGTLLYRLAVTADASDVFTRLGRAGIFVRRFAERPDWLRFGQPGGTTELHRLEAALKE
jgi:cobalamin biosynthesis protein CobC